MFKFFLDNFRITNDCIILATPMVLFFIVLQWYLQTFQPILTTPNSIIIFFITLWFGISGCFAGWFYMVKKTLQYSKKTFLYDTDRNTAILKLLLCLFKGIGKFLLSFLGLIGLCFIAKIIKYEVTIKILSTQGILDYKLFSVASLAIILFIAYWFIFCIPEIIYNYSNPIKAIINSIIKAFISFKQTFLMYIILIIIGTILNILFFKSQENPIFYFILIILSYYFILYSVILIFRNYEKSFIK